MSSLRRDFQLNMYLFEVRCTHIYCICIYIYVFIDACRIAYIYICNMDVFKYASSSGSAMHTESQRHT